MAIECSNCEHTYHRNIRYHRNFIYTTRHSKQGENVWLCEQCFSELVARVATPFRCKHCGTLANMLNVRHCVNCNTPLCTGCKRPWRGLCLCKHCWRGLCSGG